MTKINYGWEQLVCCPECRGKLNLIKSSLVCSICRITYPVIQDIPVLVQKKRIRNEEASRKFYDDEPFDVFPEDLYSPSNLPPGGFSDKIYSEIKRKAVIFDIGCGVGRFLKIFHDLGHIAIGIDLSLVSLRKIRNRFPRFPLINASTLKLPVKNNSADIIISLGVIHHTGDARKAFTELIRVLKPKGRLYLAIYEKPSNYYTIYNTIGAFFRFINYQFPLGNYIVGGICIPCFFIFDTLFIRRGRTFQKSRAMFSDFFLQPVVSFHTEEEIQQWSKQEMVKCEIFQPKTNGLICATVTK